MRRILLNKTHLVLLAIAIILIMSLLILEYAVKSENVEFVYLRHELKVCIESDNLQQTLERVWSRDRTIIFITPTYPRPEQVPELTRLSQTLMNVKNLVWIVAEDAPICSPFVAQLKDRLPLVHLLSPMPERFRGKPSKPKESSKFVFYFGDDDNTYDLSLFEELRLTSKLSMFPVGLIGTQAVSTPLVKHGKVVGFSDFWLANRKFPVDMACFAVNVHYMFEHNFNVSMPYTPGHEETGFLTNLNVRLEDIEPLANKATRVLVWHTKTKSNALIKEIVLEDKRLTQTNMPGLISHMRDIGLVGEKGKNSVKATIKW